MYDKCGIREVLFGLAGNDDNVGDTRLDVVDVEMDGGSGIRVSCVDGSVPAGDNTGCRVEKD